MADAALRLSAGFLCRFVLYETPLLKSVDVVVAIPPDSDRYARRGMSLPYQLADAIEGQLGVQWAKEALVKSSSIELRGLTWAARRRAVKGSMAAEELASL